MGALDEKVVIVVGGGRGVGRATALALAREAFAQPDDNAVRLAAINGQLLKAQAILNELQGGLNLAWIA